MLWGRLVGHKHQRETVFKQSGNPSNKFTVPFQHVSMVFSLLRNGISWSLERVLSVKTKLKVWELDIQLDSASAWPGSLSPATVLEGQEISGTTQVWTVWTSPKRGTFPGGLQVVSCSNGLINDAKTSPQRAWHAPRHLNRSSKAYLEDIGRLSRFKGTQCTGQHVFLKYQTVNMQT